MTGVRNFSEKLRLRLYTAWMQLGAVLHKITSPVILFFIFFFIFTPYALLVRIFRRHPSFDTRPASSYWISTNDSQPCRDFKRQF